MTDGVATIMSSTARVVGDAILFGCIVFCMLKMYWKNYVMLSGCGFEFDYLDVDLKMQELLWMLIIYLFFLAKIHFFGGPLSRSTSKNRFSQPLAEIIDLYWLYVADGCASHLQKCSRLRKNIFIVVNFLSPPNISIWVSLKNIPFNSFLAHETRWGLNT